MKELLSDTKFSNGFNLLSTSTNNGRKLAGVLDYNKSTKETPCWEIAQWWTPFDFINAKYSSPDFKIHDYVNESRELIVNENESSLTMKLNSNIEYQRKFGRNRTGNENWSHFLIEQSLNEPQRLGNLTKLVVSIDFIIEKCDDLSPGQELPCGQISWYFTVTDVKNHDPHYESGDNDFYWFGLPFFDSRFEVVEKYQHVDSGFVGATNKLIYKISSSDVFKGKVIFGESKHVEIDILPLLREAYDYGVKHGAMPGTVFDQLYINYMNLGWEIPGSMDCSSTFKNLSIKAYIKEG